jgi:hypothetical protein
LSIEKLHTNEDVVFEDREGYQAMNSWNRQRILWCSVINVTGLCHRQKLKFYIS